MSGLVLVVIPLRMGSTRLKNKVRADIAGQSLAQRTVGRALAIFREDADVRVLAAVDDPALQDHLENRFPELAVILTDSEIPSGTDRVAIATAAYSEQLAQRGLQVRGVVNLQGDIPFAGAEGLRAVAQYFLQSSDAQLAKAGMVTLAKAFPPEQHFEDPAAVKVVSSRDGFALYFSRHPIPHSKQSYREAIKNGALAGDLHIGVYGYTPAVLGRMCAHAPVAIEVAEGLEQLRALWLGIPILVLQTEEGPGESFRGIDTLSDLGWAQGFATGRAPKSKPRAAAPTKRPKAAKKNSARSSPKKRAKKSIKKSAKKRPKKR